AQRLGNLSCSHDPPSQRLEAQEAHEKTRRAIRALPVVYRQPLNLYLGGYSITQIAGLLRTTKAAVKKRLSVGRSRLAVKLTRDRLRSLRSRNAWLPIARAQLIRAVEWGDAGAIRHLATTEPSLLQSTRGPWGRSLLHHAAIWELAANSPRDTCDLLL